MPLKRIQEETLTSFANLIRSKTDTTDPIAPQDMADMIRSIVVGDLGPMINSMTSGTITFTQGNHREFTITHNLGHQPDILAITMISSAYVSGYWKLCSLVLIPYGDDQQLQIAYAYYAPSGDAESSHEPFITVIPFDRSETQNSITIDAGFTFRTGSDVPKSFNWVAIRL